MRTIRQAAILVAALVAGTATATAQPSLLEVVVVGRALKPGEVVGIHVTCACRQAPMATAWGRQLALVPSIDGRRWQGLLGIDLDTPAGAYPLVVDAIAGETSVTRTTMLEVQPAAFRVRRLRVAAEFVEPPEAVTARIIEEAARLEALFQTITPAASWGPFALPLATAPTPNFGSRRFFNGQPRNPHAGIDFASGAGTRVNAPAPGVVVFAGDLFFTGHTVVLDHGGGLFSLFAHLSAIDVAVGDLAPRSARLGRVGATGRATGPHLHWSVRLNGARVDPLSLVAATRTDARRLPRADTVAPKREPAGTRVHTVP